MAIVAGEGLLILNIDDKETLSIFIIHLQRNDLEVVPFSSRPSHAVKNVIWYLCLKLVFIFNTLNLKLEVVKLFQIYRDRNTKEEFKVIEL